MSILLEAGAHCVLIEGRHWNHAPSLAMSVYGKCRELIVLKKLPSLMANLHPPSTKIVSPCGHWGVLKNLSLAISSMDTAF